MAHLSVFHWHNKSRSGVTCFQRQVLWHQLAGKHIHTNVYIVTFTYIKNMCICVQLYNPIRPIFLLTPFKSFPRDHMYARCLPLYTLPFWLPFLFGLTCYDGWADELRYFVVASRNFYLYHFCHSPTFFCYMLVFFCLDIFWNFFWIFYLFSILKLLVFIFLFK